jgi:hypothetical protein
MIEEYERGTVYESEWRSWTGWVVDWMYGGPILVDYMVGSGLDGGWWIGWWVVDWMVGNELGGR